MKIFFIAPYGGAVRFQKEYDRIISILESAGAEVHGAEKTDEYQDIFRKENTERFGNNAAIHYEYIRSGVISADAVVVETSFEDFRVGHEMTLALLYNKPVLCLSKLTDFSVYIRHAGFSAAKYSEGTLKKILLRFIESVSKKSVRFRNASLVKAENRPAVSVTRRKKRIAVLGSINVDLITRVSAIPHENDVVISEGLQMNLGGKASNAAVALSRLENDVYMIGKIGNDPFGASVKTVFAAELIHTDFVYSDAFIPTGTVMVNVDARGKNTIIVNEDANIRISNKSITDLLDKFDAGTLLIDCFYTTLEPLASTVGFAISEFSKRNIPIFCDAAPVARPLSERYYSLVEFLAPNEYEAKTMTGIDVCDRISGEKAAHELRKQGARTVIVTLSAQGSVVLPEGSDTAVYYPAERVKAIDETAAGDAFRAAFVEEYLETKNINSSMKFATRAGAFAVTRFGSYTAMPNRDELSFFEK